jgi:hypothetical protein
MHETLGLSYKNSNELNHLIDTLPGPPKFKRDEIIVAGQAFDVYYRDILECIKALYSNPEFSAGLAFKPERHYIDEDMTIRMYSEMYTGKWWWATQVRKPLASGNSFTNMLYLTRKPLSNQHPGPQSSRLSSLLIKHS